MRVIERTKLLPIVDLGAYSKPHSRNDYSPPFDLHEPFRGLLGDILAAVSATLIPAALQVRRVGDLKAVGPCLLLGERFSGKSTVLEKVAEIHKYNCLTVTRVEWIRCRDLVGLPLKTVMESLQASFDRAINLAPSLLLIDDIDLLCLNSESSEASQIQESVLFSRYFVQMLDKVTEHNASVSRRFKKKTSQCFGELALTQLLYDSLHLVAVIISAQSLSTLQALIPQRCDLQFNIPSLSPRQCEALLNMLARHGVQVSHISQNQRDSIQLLLEGYLIGDLSHLARTIHSHSSATSKPCIGYEELLEFIGSYSPLSPSTAVSATPPDRSWREICGLERAKQSIVNTFMRPVVFKRIFSLVPIRISRAILLYGPPGSGMGIYSSGFHGIKPKSRR